MDGVRAQAGKLEDLNALRAAGKGCISGISGERFSLIVGETGVLSNVKYVITLTRILNCPDTARSLWGLWSTR